MDFQELETLARGFMPSRVLLTAVELDLFALLGDRAWTIPEVARSLHIDERATDILLHALASLEVLIKEEGRFRTDLVLREALDPSRPGYRGGTLKHLVHQWESWGALTECVRTGGPVGIPRNREGKTDFLLAMHHRAVDRARATVRYLDLAGVHRILDLGGGPGTYTAAFLKEIPQARAVLFDREQSFPLAREILARENLLSRVDFLGGDFLSDPIGANYDLVWCSAILHIYGPAENRALLEKIFAALSPGGRVCIKDHVLDETGTAPRDATLFAVNMLVATEQGRTYPFSETRRWLTAAGFEDAVLIKTEENESDLIVAWKP